MGEMVNSNIIINQRNGWMGWWPKEGLKAVLDPENARIKCFLIEQRELLAADAVVLDAGAGAKPYQFVFNDLEYESTDMPDGFYKEPHDFECFLDDISRPDNYYDCVVLTQVLEHVPDPLAVVKEIGRVLKPGGKLLLSVPLNTPLHGEPWHFFNFTHYGIAQLATSSDLLLSEIEKVGGGFWLLGKHFPDAFRKLVKQYDPFRAKKRGQNVGLCILSCFMLLPIWIFVYLPGAYLLRPLFYWLECVDRVKSFTLGYTAVLQKPLISEESTISLETLTKES
jgi:SAM-dependent methyltransferase